VRLSGPVSDDDLAALFAPLGAFPLWLLAVSGGSDSLALLHLIARYLKLSQPTNRVIVATVDHGLRSASAVEAHFVAAQCRALGFPHDTLHWLGDKPGTGIMNAAREARYALLEQRARQEPGQPRAVVTAHHEDDQAETVLMRLARGSGLDGLAGMSTIRWLDDAGHVALVRPLLSVPKVRLEATLRELGQSWIDDPTNVSLSTERARVRLNATQDHSKSRLTNAAVALSAVRLARARDALDAVTLDLENTCATINLGISTSFVRACFDTAPLELRVRLMGRALVRGCGVHPPATLAEIETLVERLSGLLASRIAGSVTLGGCLIVPERGGIGVYREPGRGGLPTLRLEPGAQGLWDNRFAVTLNGEAPSSLQVRALSLAEWRDLKGQIVTDALLVPAAAVTIPSFWDDGRIIAVPTLGFFAPGYEGVSAAPARISRTFRA
jgi:tRNA(Ile)-lysidine synthase